MNPIILYNNILRQGTLTATNTASGYNVLNVIDYRTYTFWRAASAGERGVMVDCGVNRTADCVGIIGHNIFSAGGTVAIHSSPNGSTWDIRLSAQAPTSDRVFFRIFTSATARWWRVWFNTSTAPAQAAVIFLGQRLTFPYPPDTPYIPYQESIELDSARSKAGHLLGSMIRYKQIEINAKFSNLARTWVINNFLPFWDIHASNMLPFFYAWDIDIYPDMVFYVTIDEKMRYKMPVSVLQYIDSIELDMVGVKEL